jgi:methenyltetrahydrofolate cyclohydrolase
MTDPARLTDLTVRELTERLASREPVPGGGSAAALAGALGAALVHMVVELTVGRADATDTEDGLRELALAAAEHQSELLNLSELDANAYAAVLRARRLPRDTDQQREARAVQVATAIREAARVPLKTAEIASNVLALAERAAAIGNRNAVSDAGVAASLAACAMRAAALNVKINLPGLPADDPLRGDAERRLVELLADLSERETAVQRAVERRIG